MTNPVSRAYAVRPAAEADDDVAQGAVVHVHRARPEMLSASMRFALPKCRWESSSAASRLCAEVMA